ncbi:DUF917 domain-containing protein [Flavisphingomonas formosensis]|uniref:DUF917 domain-containing protein n=1 Tax=Flavisphingomonas formosensis TaxID=861534 RepID=UPI0012FAD756|nr:DUF917 domain-containing protein [Sphingomonas formosensis]
MSWILQAEDLAPIALGCAMLGSGGGGDTHCAIILLGELIRQGHRIPIVDPAHLATEEVILTVGYVGAPIVLAEKLLSGGEIVSAIDAMRDRLGRPIDALIASEIGGLNGMVPLIASAMTGLPVVDADGMGRAFPRGDQVTFSIYGHSSVPAVVAGEGGEVVIITAASNARSEELTRALSVQMGSKAFSIEYPLSGEDVRRHAIPRTLSLARAIGRAISGTIGAEARFEALASMLDRQWGIATRRLFAGRITACSRDTRGGFDRGMIEIAQSGTDGQLMRIAFQNEFLVAYRDDALIATTPDIISIVDADTFHPIHSEGIRYGQQVEVLAIEAPALLKTAEALHMVGPRAFGHDCDFQPIAALPA